MVLQPQIWRSGTGKAVTVGFPLISQQYRSSPPPLFTASSSGVGWRQGGRGSFLASTVDWVRQVAKCWVFVTRTSPVDFSERTSHSPTFQPSDCVRQTTYDLAPSSLQSRPQPQATLTSFPALPTGLVLHQWHWRACVLFVGGGIWLLSLGVIPFRFIVGSFFFFSQDHFGPATFHRHVSAPREVICDLSHNASAASSLGTALSCTSLISPGNLQVRLARGQESHPSCPLYHILRTWANLPIPISQLPLQLML